AAVAGKTSERGAGDQCCEGKSPKHKPIRPYPWSLRLKCTRIRRIFINLCSNAIEILFAANEDAAVGDRRRRINRFADGVCAKNLVFWTGFHDERVAIFTRHQDLAVERDGGRGER